MNLNHSIPLLSADQHSPQASFSKWISIDVLIDSDELKDLFTHCANPILLSMQNLSEDHPFHLDQSSLLQKYDSYISDLKKGMIPQLKEIRTYFYFFLTAHMNDIFMKELSKGKKKLFYNTPLVEFKPICLNLSKVDHTLRVMPLSPSGVLWGLKISFPGMVQKYQSPLIESIDFKQEPNGILFSKIRKWIRDNTRATPFLIGSKKVNLPIRLGKKCLNWINHHPQLIPLRLQVHHEPKN